MREGEPVRYREGSRGNHVEAVFVSQQTEGPTGGGGDRRRPSRGGFHGREKGEIGKRDGAFEFQRAQQSLRSSRAQMRRRGGMGRVLLARDQFETFLHSVTDRRGLDETVRVGVRDKRGRRVRADQVVTAREDAHGGDHVSGEGSEVEPIDRSETQLFEKEMFTIARLAVQLEQNLQSVRALSHKQGKGEMIDLFAEERNTI
jgi:hypothetical protein